MVTRPQESCPICGQPGDVFLHDLKDKLFGVPGKWKSQRCRNDGCRSVWINPVIVEADLHKAYANYYTHSGIRKGTYAGIVKQSVRRGVYDRFVKEKYWALRYGYGELGASTWSKFLGLLVYLVPHKSFYLDTHIMLLHAVKNGCVLDVGCGNGERLELLKMLGWNVKGIDPDRQAIEEAKQKGLDVNCADPKSMNYSTNSFDAVISSHVIEHAPNPLELLTECARVLKPGGQLVIVTPNAESFGFNYYGRCWRGLEPPRHLQIFSRTALEHIIRRAGLRVIESKSLVAPQILYASHVIKKEARVSNGATKLRVRSILFVKWLTLLESLMLWIKPDRGEILAVIATK